LPNWKGCDEKFSIEKNLSRGNNWFRGLYLWDNQTPGHTLEA
jgi:hypothetical protein